MFPVSYEKMYKLLDRKGLSFNKLRELKVITDMASRNFREGKDVHIGHVANICRYLDVPIEDVVEVIRD